MKTVRTLSENYNAVKQRRFADRRSEREIQKNIQKEKRRTYMMQYRARNHENVPEEHHDGSVSGTFSNRMQKTRYIQH